MKTLPVCRKRSLERRTGEASQSDCLHRICCRKSDWIGRNEGGNAGESKEPKNASGDPKLEQSSTKKTQLNQSSQPPMLAGEVPLAEKKIHFDKKKSYVF